MCSMRLETRHEPTPAPARRVSNDGDPPMTDRRRDAVCGLVGNCVRDRPTDVVLRVCRLDRLWCARDRRNDPDQGRAPRRSHRRGRPLHAPDVSERRDRAFILGEDAVEPDAAAIPAHIAGRTVRAPCDHCLSDSARASPPSRRLHCPAGETQTARVVRLRMVPWNARRRGLVPDWRLARRRSPAAWTTTPSRPA